MKHTLKRSLAGKRPSRQNVAQELHLSVRTLQRRLNDAGITFAKLVQDTRRELAHQYLQESTVELGEAAFLLGYEDTNSFFRAFHGWEVLCLVSGGQDTAGARTTFQQIERERKFKMKTTKRNSRTIRAQDRKIVKRAFHHLTTPALGVFLCTTGVSSAADMSNGADNFYKSDEVTTQKVTFKNQYKMKVVGVFLFPC